MKKKIGFIDYYIDEWHANNYPALIRASRFKDKFDVAIAWEEISPRNKKHLNAWCTEQGVRAARSLEEVVAESDCIVVLSPDNAERHEDLADLALRSGKPVYIDKPIAPSLAAAGRLFEKAEAHDTPIMSSSALRFGSALRKTLKESIGGEPVHFASARGGGLFPVYAIHQLEMVAMSVGIGAKRVLQCGNPRSDLMLIDYEDGRRATINLMTDHPFQISICYGEEKAVAIDHMDDFFEGFIDGLLTFFETGKSLAPKEETLEIAALLEAGTKALKRRDQWTPVPALEPLAVST